MGETLEFRGKKEEQKKSQEAFPDQIRRLVVIGVLKLNEEYDFSYLCAITGSTDTKDLIRKLNEETFFEVGSKVRIIRFKYESGIPDAAYLADPLELELDRLRLKIWNLRLFSNKKYSLPFLARTMGTLHMPLLLKILGEYAKYEKDGKVQMLDGGENFRIIKALKSKNPKIERIERSGEGRSAKENLKILHAALKEVYGKTPISLDETIRFPSQFPGLSQRRSKLFNEGGRAYGIKLLAEAGLAEEISPRLYVLK